MPKPITKFKSILILALLAILLSSPGNVNANTNNVSKQKQKWVGTWSTAPQLVEPRNMPPEPGLSNNTLRQIVRVSLGGDSLRVRFSNEFSTSPVTMKSVQVAVSNGGNSIEKSSLKELKFDGETMVTMEPGSKVTSDPFSFKIEPRTDVAISIWFGETSPDVTGHPGSRTTSYLVEGNHVTEPELENAATADRWYVINGIDVKAVENAGAVAILGNSITDGRGSGTNKQNRWPDIFAEQLLQNRKTKNVSVLNQGIGGNCVLRFCLGPSAINRFERDVAQQHGVKWLIILEGVNDLGQTPDAEKAKNVADKLIETYIKLIDEAHNLGIKVYGATILPFGKSFYYSDFRETARQRVNEWIRSGNHFDALIDFDKIMRNPEEPSSLLPDVHSGDFLHPNELGYKIMGESIDLKLFE